MARNVGTSGTFGPGLLAAMQPAAVKLDSQYMAAGISDSREGGSKDKCFFKMYYLHAHRYASLIPKGLPFVGRADLSLEREKK